jgi:hypothetical protein
VNEEFSSEAALGRGPDPRQLSAWLLLGILTIPGLFVWFTLRRGYSTDLRIGAFLNLAAAVMFWALGSIAR